MCEPMSSVVSTAVGPDVPARAAGDGGVARAPGQHGGRESEGEEAHPAILARAAKQGRRRRLWGTTPSAGFPNYVGGGSRSPPAGVGDGKETRSGGTRGWWTGGRGPEAGEAWPGIHMVIRAPPPGAAPAVTVPECRPTTCWTMARPEARARHRARLRRAVEALEHVRQVVGLDPRSLVVDGQGPVRHPHRDRAVGRSPLGGVVEQVGDGALDGPGLALDPPGQGGHVELAARRAEPDPRDGPVDHLGEVEGLHDLGQRLVAGELDEVADEVRQLLDLGADVVEELGLLLGREPAGLVGLGEQVEVRAQRGERRPQLVAGVGHQPALPVARGLEGGEHGVERRGQAGDLVVALDRQRGQLLGPGDLLDRRGQPAYGSQAVARHAPPGGGGAHDAREAEQQHHRAEPAEHLLLGLQGLGQDQRAAVGGRHRGDPVVLAARTDRADGLGEHAARHGVLLSAEGHVGSLVEGLRLAARRQEDDADVGRTGGPRREPRIGLVQQRRRRRRLPGAVEQGLVQRRLHLHPDGQEHRQRHQRDREADRDRGQQDHPAGQRPPVVPALLRPARRVHDSLST